MIRKLKISCWGTEIRKLKKSFSCTFWTSYSRGLYTHSAKKSLLKDIVKAKVQKKKTLKQKLLTHLWTVTCRTKQTCPFTLHIPKPISIKCCFPLHACLQLRAHYLWFVKRLMIFTVCTEIGTTIGYLSSVRNSQSFSHRITWTSWPFQASWFCVKAAINYLTQNLTQLC